MSCHMHVMGQKLIHSTCGIGVANIKHQYHDANLWITLESPLFIWFFSRYSVALLISSGREL